MSPSSHATSLNFAMLSHPGRVRKGNEDTCAADPDLGAFLVCDGMGGAAAGEVASQLATRAFLQALVPSAASPIAPAPRLAAAIHAANQAVFQQASHSPELSGMGTTLVALLLDPAQPPNRHPALTLAHVGDSRCYRLRDGVLTLLTDDHSFVEEQRRLGEITADQARTHPLRNVITRAVGSFAAVEPDLQPLDPIPGDLYLLASDGLTRELDDAQLALALHHALETAAPHDLPTLCQLLIDRANHAGGGDNITVLLLEIS